MAILSKQGHVEDEAAKAAYRRLALRYHPDRNPAGRERFVAVQRAYERLQAGAAGGQGPRLANLLLLLKVPAAVHRKCTVSFVLIVRACTTQWQRAVGYGGRST